MQEQAPGTYSGPSACSQLPTAARPSLNDLAPRATGYGQGFIHRAAVADRDFDTTRKALKGSRQRRPCVQGRYDDIQPLEPSHALQLAPPSTQNWAQNGWFSDTGPDASIRV